MERQVRVKIEWIDAYGRGVGKLPDGTIVIAENAEPGREYVVSVVREVRVGDVRAIYGVAVAAL
ncbi:MAG: hypothetical protein QXW40_08205 [Thermofilum sp.]